MAVRIAQLFGKRDDICSSLGSTRFATYCSGGTLNTKTLCCADTTRTFPQCLSYDFDQDTISWCCVGSSDTDNCYTFFDPSLWEQSSGAVSCAATDAVGDVVAYCPYLTSCVRTWSAPLNSDELVQCQLPQGALKQLNAPAPSSSTSSPPSAPSSSSDTPISSTSFTSITSAAAPSSSSTSSSSSSIAPSPSASPSSSPTSPAASLSPSLSPSSSPSSSSSDSSSLSSTISSTFSNGLPASTSSTTGATGVTASDTSPTSSSTNLPATTSSSSASLSSGALAGVILGAILGVALIAILVFWLFWRRPKDKFADNPPSGYNSAAPGTEVGPLGSQQRSPVAMSDNGRVYDGRVYDMDSKQKYGYRG